MVYVPPPLRRMAGPGYLLAGLLVLSMPLDVLPNIWPPHPDWPAWRYAAVSVMSGSIGTLALGLVLASAVAAAERARRILEALKVAHWVCAIAIAVAALLLVIDAAHARGADNAPIPLSYHLGTIKITAKCLATSALFLVAGMASRKAAQDIEATSSPGHSAATLAGGHARHR